MSPRRHSASFNLAAAARKGVITGVSIAESFSFFVAMTPAVKERVRVVRAPKKGRDQMETVGGVTSYTPRKTQEAEERVAMEWLASCRRRLPPRSHIRFELTAFYRRPHSHFRKRRVDGGVLTEESYAMVPGARHDWDNLAKLVCDALNGLAWDDDRWIAEAQVRKVWGERGEDGAMKEGFLVYARTLEVPRAPRPRTTELLHDESARPTR